MDIAPELLEKIERQFFDTVSYGKEIGRLSVRIADGVATYKEAEEYAVKVGEALAQAFRDNLSSDILPDGKMYFNIANRVVREPMEGLHELVAEAARQVQQSLNEAAGIRIRPQVPALDTDRIDGIVNRLASEEHFDDVAWILDEPVVNFAQHAVDESIRKNVDFHARSGFEPKITRTAESGACKWCRELAGTYTYGDVRYQGAGVWRRHENCRCLIEYIPQKGRRQTVYNYREANLPEGRERLERRRAIGLHQEDNDNNPKRTIVMEAIRKGTVEDYVNQDLQRRHLEAFHDEGKSYLFGSEADAETLYKKLRGTGSPVLNSRGEWTGKERVVNDGIVGIYSNGEKEEATDSIMIIYSNTGAHLYPRKKWS